MSAPVRQRGFLLALAAEAVAPLVPGCGTDPGHALDRFGPAITASWADWLRGQPLARKLSAVTELADLPPARARPEVLASVERLAGSASPGDRATAVEYLTAIPRFTQRTLVIDVERGGFTLPHGFSPDSATDLLQLLPVDAPPFPPGTALPGTLYTLKDLLPGGTSCVCYRVQADLAPLAVKFLAATSLAELVRNDPTLRSDLASLEQASPGERVVRLHGFNLESPRPYLVWEHAGGGDLPTLLTNLNDQTGHGFPPDECFKLIEQIVEGLASLHAAGLVHGAVVPASVLLSGSAIKLADAVVGRLFADHARRHSRVGSVPPEQLSPSDFVALKRGAGTLLYLSPEQRRGDTPGPGDDLYGVGVLWFQLLANDLTRPADDWRTTLEQHPGVSAAHRDLLSRCLGTPADRPADAGALLSLMRPESVPRVAAERYATVTPEERRREREHKEALLAGLRAVRDGLAHSQSESRAAARFTPADPLLLLLALGLPWLLLLAGVPVPAVLALSVLVGAGVVWLRLRQRRVRAARALHDLHRQIDALAGSHPDEVESWGGPRVLLNPSLLAEFISTLEDDLRTLSTELLEE
jgi:serine/threonine-protein kinase